MAPKRISHTEHYLKGYEVVCGLSGALSQEGISATMELCYLVSISILEQILQSQAKSDTAYSLLANEDTVTVVHYGPAGLIDQFAFPIVFRIPEVPEDEGTMMLLVATERSRESESFWVPLETKLLHCCSTTPLA